MDVTDVTDQSFTVCCSDLSQLDLLMLGRLRCLICLALDTEELTTHTAYIIWYAMLAHPVRYWLEPPHMRLALA
jgi:hypothetical protein